VVRAAGDARAFLVGEPERDERGLFEFESVCFFLVAAVIMGCWTGD